MDNSITENQEDLIDKLVDTVGFVDSPNKEKYFKMIINKCCNNYVASIEIERLVLEKNLRFGGVKIRTRLNDHIRVSDLSEFVFCPASYAIKQSHILPPTIKMEEGTEEHEKVQFEDYLEFLKEKYKSGSWTKEESKAKNLGFLYKIHQDLINSKIIYKGHEEEDKSFYYDKDQNLTGKPDYILERKDNTKFVVEEKHTWNKIKKNRPWKNHIIQIMGYVSLLKKYSISDGYMQYFKWGYYRNNKEIKEKRIYHVKVNKNYEKLLIGYKKRLEKLIEEGKMSFNTNGLNLNKCYGCSSRPWCRHKSGRFNTLYLKYYKNSKITK